MPNSHEQGRSIETVTVEGKSDNRGKSVESSWSQEDKGKQFQIELNLKGAEVHGLKGKFCDTARKKKPAFKTYKDTVGSTYYIKAIPPKPKTLFGSRGAERNYKRNKNKNTRLHAYPQYQLI